MMCLCNRGQMSDWTRRSYFGRLGWVLQAANEVRATLRSMIVHTSAISVASVTRRAVVQLSREGSLADGLLSQVRRCAACLRPLLVLTDGWSAYPGSIRRAFREKVKHTKGVGRAGLHIWPQLHIGTVIKHTKNKRVVQITRQMAHGVVEQAEKLLHCSQMGAALNTPFISRLNATFT